MTTLRLAPLVLAGLTASAQKTPPFEPDYQYHLGDLAIPRAHAAEPVRSAFSLEAALRHLDEAALIWTRQAQCVSCHTSGTYLLVRPQFPAGLGAPAEEVRDFFISVLDRYDSKPPEWFTSFNPAQVIYTAAGLAEYDARIRRALSPATDRALRNMLSVQLPSGSWSSATCWPPLESSAYHAATIAARAIAVAPGWLADLRDETGRDRISRLIGYLRGPNAQHDYDHVSVLWTAGVWPDLLPSARRRELVSMVRSRQNRDGGWSLRAFARPEQWGDGNRATRLRAEPEADRSASDAHMTGLAVLALAANGARPGDPAIRRAIAWLKSNQRESGRWWTRSLNTDKWNFITFSATAYAALAIATCGRQ